MVDLGTAVSAEIFEAESPVSWCSFKMVEIVSTECWRREVLGFLGFVCIIYIMIVVTVLCVFFYVCVCVCVMSESNK